MSLNESIVENALLTWFYALDYAIGHGPHMASGELAVAPGTIAVEMNFSAPELKSKQIRKASGWRAKRKM